MVVGCFFGSVFFSFFFCQVKLELKGDRENSVQWSDKKELFRW